MTSAASRTTELMSKGDWNKIIWSTGSQGEYNTIRKHCGCACGHGTFIPVLGPSGQVQLCSGAPDAAGGAPVDSAGERRRLIEAKLARQRELHEARPTLTLTLTLTVTLTLTLTLALALTLTLTLTLTLNLALGARRAAPHRRVRADHERGGVLRLGGGAP